MGRRVEHSFFTRKMFFRSVLASPLAGIGLALASMGDTILIGHGIGMEGLAAIGYSSPVFLIGAFLAFGLSMGGAIVYANLTHEGRKEEAQDIFNFFLQYAALAGFLLTAAGILWNDGLLALLGADPEDRVVYGMAKSYLFYILLGLPFEILMEVLAAYLRNDDADALSVGIQTASGVLNLIISAVLLFVFDWGVIACSVGFFVSNLLATVICLGYILIRTGGELTIRWKTAAFRDAVKPLRLGFATSSEYIFDALFTLVAIHLIMELDGPEGVAIFNIIENLSVFFIFLYEMIGKTSQPLFSVFFAECNYRELHRIFLYALAYCLLWGAGATALVMVYPQITELLFGLGDMEDVSKVYYAVQVFCISTIFQGIALLLQNYLQSEEDERGAFLIVFLRRCGVSLPLALLLFQFGFQAFWMVYPLSEFMTLIIIWLYIRRKGERKNVVPERVYAASFLGVVDDVADQMEAIEEFARGWGADERKLYTLRLTLEEVTGFMSERARRQAERPLLTQLTLIALEDGSLKLHLRDDGQALNPFELEKAQEKNFQVQPEKKDFGVIGLHMVKNRVGQCLYQNSHGFNTIMVSI